MSKQHTHESKKGIIRISSHSQKWFEFTLQKGFFFGEDSKGLYVCPKPSLKAKLQLIYRYHSNGWYSRLEASITTMNIKTEYQKLLSENDTRLQDTIPYEYKEVNLYKGLYSILPKARKTQVYKHYVGESRFKHNNIAALA